MPTRRKTTGPPGRRDTGQDGPSRSSARSFSVLEYRLDGSRLRPLLADPDGAVVSVLDRLLRLGPGHIAVLARLPLPLELFIHQVDARVAVLRLRQGPV